MYKSRTEAYCGILYTLNKLSNKSTIRDLNKTEIDWLITLTKRSLLRHTDNIKLICSNIDAISSRLAPADKQLVSKLVSRLNASTFTQTAQEKWENPLGRRLESEICIKLLHNPTTSMMLAVNKVSRVILHNLELIEKMITKQPDDFSFNFFIAAFKHFIDKLTTDGSLGFGRLESMNSKKAIDAIKSILSKNDRSELTKIICIHFMFARDLFRSSNYKIQNAYGNVISSVANLNACNRDFYDQPLYQYRGRKRSKKNNYAPYTSQLGLMLNEQDATGLPFYLTGKWHADCKMQAPELDSHSPNYPVVRDMIDNEVPYVSGFSGMTSLLMPQFIHLCGNTATKDDQRLYLCSVMSYIVSGGYHSMHEVLAPCAHILNLMPFYSVEISSFTQSSPPPDYNVFFSLIDKCDPDFKTVADGAWNKFYQYLDAYFDDTTSDVSNKIADNNSMLRLIIDSLESTLTEEFKKIILDNHPIWSNLKSAYKEQNLSVTANCLCALLVLQSIFYESIKDRQRFKNLETCKVIHDCEYALATFDNYALIAANKKLHNAEQVIELLNTNNIPSICVEYFQKYLPAIADEDLTIIVKSLTKYLDADFLEKIPNDNAKWNLFKNTSSDESLTEKINRLCALLFFQNTIRYYENNNNFQSYSEEIYLWEYYCKARSNSRSLEKAEKKLGNLGEVIELLKASNWSQMLLDYLGLDTLPGLCREGEIGTPKKKLQA